MKTHSRVIYFALRSCPHPPNKVHSSSLDDCHIRQFVSTLVCNTNALSSLLAFSDPEVDSSLDSSFPIDRDEPLSETQLRSRTTDHVENSEWLYVTLSPATHPSAGAGNENLRNDIPHTASSGNTNDPILSGLVDEIEVSDSHLESNKSRELEDDSAFAVHRFVLIDSGADSSRAGGTNTSRSVGVNRFGRSGTERCGPCRRWRQKVLSDIVQYLTTMDYDGVDLKCDTCKRRNLPHGGKRYWGPKLRTKPQTIDWSKGDATQSFLPILPQLPTPDDMKYTPTDAQYLQYLQSRDRYHYGP